MGAESAEHEAVAASACDVNVDLEGVSLSSIGEAIGDLGIVRTMLTRLGLSLARFSEKVSNLSIFVMHLATLETEFEALILEKDHAELGSFEKELEFDLLSGLLDSEVRELDGFLDTLQAGIADARERVSSCAHLGEPFLAMQDKLLDSEQYLKQCEEQFAEIKMQSATFRRTLSSFKRVENGNGEAGEIVREYDKPLNVNAAIKMQTIEQQRHILRMLEKSLAREMDLEKNFNDSREIQEKLKLRMSSLEQELVHTEEESIDVWERWFEADNAREILMGISKGMLNVKASANKYQNQYNVVCSEVRDMENLTVQLKENVSNAESRANSAEAKCKLLTETNSKLSEEMAFLKDGGGTSARVDLLERQLKESDLRLQNAVASAEASQEKQSMLYSTIRDMANVIKDFKSKVSRAESRADSAEDNCILLSESNAKLNEELSFLRSRLEFLEGSLHREEEAKMATAKDIEKQTKVFKNLVTQLAVERERLKRQLSSLASENKILVVKLKQTYKDPS